MLKITQIDFDRFISDIYKINETNPKMPIKFKRDGIIYDKFFFTVHKGNFYVGIEKINEYYVPEKYVNFLGWMANDIMPKIKMKEPKNFNIEDIFDILIKSSELVTDFRMSLSTEMFKYRFKTTEKEKYYEIELTSYERDRFNHYKNLNAQLLAEVEKNDSVDLSFLSTKVIEETAEEIEWKKELRKYIKEHNL